MKSKKAGNHTRFLLVLLLFFSAVVTSFVGSGESGFRDDTGTKATLANPQQLEIDSMKRRLFLSDTVSLHPMHLTLTPPV